MLLVDNIYMRMKSTRVESILSYVDARIHSLVSSLMMLNSLHRVRTVQVFAKQRQMMNILKDWCWLSVLQRTGIMNNWIMLSLQHLYHHIEQLFPSLSLNISLCCSVTISAICRSYFFLHLPTTCIRMKHSDGVRNLLMNALQTCIWAYYRDHFLTLGWTVRRMPIMPRI